MYELVSEIQNFKFKTSTLIQNIKIAIPIDILQALNDFGLIKSEYYCCSLNISHSLFVSIASCM